MWKIMCVKIARKFVERRLMSVDKDIKYNKNISFSGLLLYRHPASLGTHSILHTTHTWIISAAQNTPNVPFSVPITIPLPPSCYNSLLASSKITSVPLLLFI